MNKEKKREFIDEVLYFFFVDNFHFSDLKEMKEKLKNEFEKYPYATKKYRKFMQKDLDNELKNDGYNLYIKNKKKSIISKIMNDSFIKNYYNIYKEKLLSLCFDYLTTLDDLYIYNLPKEENEITNNINNINESTDNYSDSEYLNYIGDKNIQQKICLICIIDRYKYSE